MTETTPARPERVTCPHCGASTNHLRVEETCTRTALAFVDGGTLRVNMHVVNYDDGNSDWRFICNDCYGTWEVPSDFALEYV